MSNFTVFTGSMFSGKTTALINVIENYCRAKKKILVLNHSFDNRYVDNMEHDIVTHKRYKIECKMINSVEDIEALDFKDLDAIFIDEVQFFNVDVLKKILNAKNINTKIYASGLDLSWQCQPFAPTQYMMSLADKVVKMKAVCSRCNDYAHCISFKKNDDGNASNIQVGSDDIYEPVCMTCFNKLRTKEY